MNRAGRILLVAIALLLPLLSFAADRVTWTATIPADAKPGSAAIATLKATIEKGWHLYSLTKVEGPTPTTIDAVAPLKITGKIDAPTPVKKFDPNFKANVEFFETEATFQVPVTLGPDPKVDKLQVHFQTCNDRTCEFPKTVDVPLTGAAATEVAVWKGDVDDARSKGLLAFIGFAFSAGLLALLTPCVFPMVPITVSFFTKRRDELGQKATILHAVAYCLGIIGAFTVVGLGTAIVFGASSVQNFATNPVVNLALAAIFVLLSLNLFGMLQVSLPSGLTNAFAPHKKTGLLAPLTMGLTFTLTSFTCTAPFVGTILVSAANGDIVYPLVGMLAFSSAFALPFFLLALFPQYLSRLPKSGAWLEMVKAFMGFLEIAAAVKFLSNADLVWGTGLISRATFLVIWAVVLVAAGLFLLRVIRLPKVDIPKKLGGGRLAVVAVTFAAAIWLATGVTGRSLGDVEAFLPPGKADGWTEDYNRALQIAKRDHKPLLIDFTGVTCTNCRWMERNMFPLPDVAAEFPNFVLTRVFTDRSQDHDNQALMLKLTKKVTLPIYVVLSPDEKVLRTFEGKALTKEDYLAFLKGKKGT